MNSTRSENVSPDAEAKCATRRAFLACPRFVIGYPSRVVSIASGVPGVLNRIAGTAPPTVAPFMTPTRNPNTGNSADSENPNTEIRIGRDTAIRKGPLRPGVAPVTIPARNPVTIIRIVTGISTPRMLNASGPRNTAVMPAHTYSRTVISSRRSVAAGACRRERRTPAATPRHLPAPRLPAWRGSSLRSSRSRRRSS